MALRAVAVLDLPRPVQVRGCTALTVGYGVPVTEGSCWNVLDPTNGRRRCGAASPPTDKRRSTMNRVSFRRLLGRQLPILLADKRSDVRSHGPECRWPRPADISFRHETHVKDGFR